MKKLLLSTILLSMQFGAYAYDQVQFKGEIKSPLIGKISGITVIGDKLAVADSKNNVIFLFDADGKFYKKSSAPLKEPVALAAGNNRLYVVDKGNSRIVVLDAEGALQWAFSGPGSLAGQLDGPAGVAYGTDDRVYVTNSGKSTIEVFNSDGIFLYNFPAVKPDGSKAKPGQIVMDRAGFIYVSDPASARIFKYDRAGKVIREYLYANDSMTIDEYGIIYAVNSKEGKVYEISSESGAKLGVFGTKGKSQMAFAKLVDVAIDANGDICLADEGNKKVTVIHVEGAKPDKLAKAQPVDRFNLKGPVKKYPYKSDTFTVKPDQGVIANLPEMKEIALLGDSGKKTPLIKYGDKQGQVKGPKGMMADEKGKKLFISDTGNNRVQIFSADGAYINQFGESGSDEGNFKAPAGITVNASGNIFVADARNKRVQAFNQDGMFLFSVGPQVDSVTLQNPVGVRVDAKKNIYILDAGLKRVIVADGAGKLQRVWEETANLKDPVAIAYDWKSYFYILDRGDFNVKIYDDQGRFVSSFFAKGMGERELKDPQCIAVADNKLFIADYEGAKVLAFDLSYIPEPPVVDPPVVDAKQVKLSWSQIKTPWLKNYAVYRSTNPVGSKKLGPADKTEYVDTGLTPETTYYYYVAGISVTGDTGAKAGPLAVYFAGPEKKKAAAALPEGLPGLGTSVDIESGGDEADSKNVAPLEIVPDKDKPILIFSANYKFYEKNPIGIISIKNNTDDAYKNAKISFFLKDFTDLPSDNEIAEIKPRSNTSVPIKATLNNKVLTINEDTPIQCQFTLTYYLDGAEKTITRNLPIKVLSKNAIIWDDAARLGNFITVSDNPIQVLKAGLMGKKKAYMDKAEFLNNNVVEALMIWEGLGELGVNYQADPTSPFTASATPEQMAVTQDTVQFPRTTLKLKSGDCDDLTALYASMLKAAGLNAAILDMPGHIALMVDSGETDAKNVGIPEESLIKYKETWWVGIEGTMTGSPFYEGVKHLAGLYKASGGSTKDGGSVNVIEVDNAIQKFAAVTLPETEYDSKINMTAFGDRVEAAIKTLAVIRYDYFKDYYGKILDVNADDMDANINLGILNGQYDKKPEAEKYFKKVLGKDPVNAAALVGLGNLSFNSGKFPDARDYYFKATKADPYDANVWLNLARVAKKLNNLEDVQIFGDRAVKLNPEARAVISVLMTQTP